MQMLRTIQCPLPFDPDLLETIRIYNQAVQHVIDIGWALKTYNKTTLHRKTYKTIREKYPSLQSSLVQCARDVASDMLKGEKFKHKKPVKKEISGIRYNQRTFTPFLESNQVSLSTIRGRKRYNLIVPVYFHQYLHGTVKSLILHYKKNSRRIIAYFTLELPNVSVRQPTTFLGVDRGIRRAAVCSNNFFYPTNHILAIKWKYQQLRQKLQSKGTRSAKRKLRELSGRERRFMTDENRKISKWVCELPYDCIVLENIRGLKQHSKNIKRISKKLRRKFGNWAYYQLEQFLIERAEKLGKMILFVNPKCTSRRCSRCGYISKSNRASRSVFFCRECWFELNADLNAARNLSVFGKAEFGRASVNSPNVAVLPLTLTLVKLGRVLATNY
ncbi:MAG: RNA-guided endonuclease InsQ/TnpB family protein [Candidatus Thorarchaeota archaeon]